MTGSDYRASTFHVAGNPKRPRKIVERSKRHDSDWNAQRNRTRNLVRYRPVAPRNDDRIKPVSRGLVLDEIDAGTTQCGPNGIAEPPALASIRIEDEQGSHPLSIAQ
jgi:hypothetical protein